MDVEENNPEAPSRLQPATLTVELLPAINAALWHNHIPALTGLSIQNNTDETVADVVIDLVAEPPALRPRSWRLAQVSPRQVRTLSDLDVQLDGAFLSSLTEGIRGRVSLVARVDNRLVAEQRQEVRFLAHNEWGWRIGDSRYPCGVC